MAWPGTLVDPCLLSGEELIGQSQTHLFNFEIEAKDGTPGQAELIALKCFLKNSTTGFTIGILWVNFS